MYSTVDSPLNGYKWVWLFVHGSLNAIFSNKGHSLHVRYQLIYLVHTVYDYFDQTVTVQWDISLGGVFIKYCNIRRWTKSKKQIHKLILVTCASL